MTPILEHIDWTKDNSEESAQTLKELALKKAERGEVDIYDAIAF